MTVDNTDGDDARRTPQKPSAEQTKEDKSAEAQAEKRADQAAEKQSVKSPNGRLPESKLPESKLPESKLPESKLPESKLPESKLPENQLSERMARVEPPHRADAQAEQEAEMRADAQVDAIAKQQVEARSKQDHTVEKQPPTETQGAQEGQQSQIEADSQARLDTDGPTAQETRPAAKEWDLEREARTLPDEYYNEGPTADDPPPPDPSPPSADDGNFLRPTPEFKATLDAFNARKAEIQTTQSTDRALRPDVLQGAEAQAEKRADQAAEAQARQGSAGASLETAGPKSQAEGADGTGSENLVRGVATDGAAAVDNGVDEGEHPKSHASVEENSAIDTGEDGPRKPADAGGHRNLAHGSIGWSRWTRAKSTTSQPMSIGT